MRESIRDRKRGDFQSITFITYPFSVGEPIGIICSISEKVNLL